MEHNDITAWALPGNHPTPRDELKLQLEFYEENILLRGFGKGVSWVRHVSADDIAMTLSEHTGLSSGVLPEGALWWGSGASGQMVALWRPPQVRRVALQTEPLSPPERYAIPMPGLLFLCAPGRAPWVYASPQRPESPAAELYKAPTYNVFSDGRVCPGNHRFPEDVGLIPDSFFQSHFSPTGDTEGRSQSHPKDLRALWAELNGRTEYPLEDLVAQGTFAEAVASVGQRQGGVI